MCQRVAEHRRDRADRLSVPGVRVPSQSRVDERPECHRRVTLPVGALKRVTVEDGVDEVGLEVGSQLIGNLVLDEVPTELEYLVVAKVLLRSIPGEQFPQWIHDGGVPGKLRIDITGGHR